MLDVVVEPPQEVPKKTARTASSAIAAIRLSISIDSLPVLHAAIHQSTYRSTHPSEHTVIARDMATDIRIASGSDWLSRYFETTSDP